MNQPTKRTLLSIGGMVLLLIACVLGVQLIFAWMGTAFSTSTGDSQSQSAPVERSQSQEQILADASEDGAGSVQSAPSFCPFCGEGLPSSFQWGQFCPYCGEQVSS